MSLQGFFEGPGPYYRLPGGRPGDNQALIADADGKVTWQGVADPGTIAALEARVDAVEQAEATSQDAIAGVEGKVEAHQ